MAKSNRPRRKPTSAKRAAPSSWTTKRSSRSRKTKTATIELKPIRVQIAHAVDRLRRSDDESIKLTVERLERCLAELDAICDEKSRFGCGPVMSFPAP